MPDILFYYEKEISFGFIQLQFRVEIVSEESSFRITPSISFRNVIRGPEAPDYRPEFTQVNDTPF